MVLEEDSAATTPTRLDELITLQSGGWSRWFVQHMPRSGSAARGRTQISRQLDILLASTSENVEEEAAATAPATAPATAQAAQAATAQVAQAAVA